MGAEEKVAVGDPQVDQSFSELAGSIRLLTNMYKYSSLPFVIIYADGQVVTCNHAFQKLTGYTLKELNEVKWSAIVPEDWCKHDPMAHQKYKGSQGRFETMLIRKDLSRVMVDLFAHEHRNRSGKLLFYHIFVSDITERKRAELEREQLMKWLMAERELFEEVLRQMPAGVIIAEAPSGKIILSNKQVERMWRLSMPLPHNGHDLYKGYHPDGRLYSVDEWPLMRSIHKGEVVSDEKIIFVRGDGTRGVMHVSSSPIFDRAGNIMAAVATFNDVTDSKRAEEALKESERKYRELVETAHEGIWAFDSNSNTTFVNPRMAEMLGYTVDEMIGRPISDFMDDKFTELYMGYLERRKKGIKEQHDFELIKKDRTRVYTSMEISPIIREHGYYLGSVVLVADITRRKRAEEALIESKNRAELYVDLMGHDINNINQISMGYLELALDMLETQGRLEANDMLLIKKPLEALKNCSKLIDNVRKIQRAKNGEFKQEVVDAGKILESVCKEMVATSDREVTIHYIPVSGCYVLANVLLRDVFVNIVENAVKHSVGPIEISIGVSRVVVDGGEYCNITFDDNGPGIPEEQKGRVFNRLQQDNVKDKGIGLGLYMVKTLVEDFHGKVWVEDRVPGDYGKGCRFVVMLPIVNEKEVS